MSHTNQGNTKNSPAYNRHPGHSLISLYCILFGAAVIIGYALYSAGYTFMELSNDIVIHRVTNSEYPECVAEKLLSRPIKWTQSGPVDITPKLIDSAIAECTPNKSEPTVNDRLKEIVEKKSGQGQLNELKLIK